MPPSTPGLLETRCTGPKAAACTRSHSASASGPSQEGCFFFFFFSCIVQIYLQEGSTITDVEINGDACLWRYF